MRLVVSVFLFFASSLAFAANNRSAVSLNGSDLNPCTTAAPCRSFTAAMAQTNAGGEIIALDSAGYGPFTINMSVTVSGAPGIHAAITVSSGNAIGVSAGSSDRVTLRNLVLLGTGGGSLGIDIGNAGIVNVVDVAISAFNADGIFAFGNVELIADHCQITDNIAATGIELFASKAAIKNSQLSGNAYGLKAEESAAATISHCLIAMNNNGGVAVTGFAGGTASTVLIDGCEIVANALGVSADNTGGAGTALLRLSDNVIFGNGTGVQGGAGGTIDSYGNNKINGNTPDLGSGTTLVSISQK